MNIDNSVKINGGKSKGCEGIITDLKNVFCLVKLTKDKKGVPVFGTKSCKVKKIYLEVIEPPPIEMPTQENLVAVDTLNNDIFETMSNNMAGSAFLPQNQDTLKEIIEEVKEEVKPYVPPSAAGNLRSEKQKQSILTDENNVSFSAPTMDDALNWKKDNEKLTIQLESMVGFQSMACSEIADLKMEIKELRDQLNDSCRLDKIEQIKKLINTI